MTNNNVIPIDATIVSHPNDHDLDGFADNPQARCPILLLLDTSYSMNGAPIEALNKAVKMFYEDLRSSRTIAMSAEVCVIPFGDESSDVLLGFEPIIDTSAEALPPLVASGRTPLGGAIRTAIHEANQRCQYYSRQGVPHYPPVVVTLTDGLPNDVWLAPVKELSYLANNGDFVSIPVAIGEHADLNILNSFATHRFGAQQLKGLNFKEFFKWLSDSIKHITSGSVQAKTKLAPTEHYDWNIQ